MNSAFSLHFRRFGLSRFSPAQLIALTFGAAILGGTLLLWLPLSHEPGQTVSLLQALFMATSAVCVTGLGVVDIGTTFSPFGEAVMLLLVQFGGLGLITVGTMTALLLRRRVGVRSRLNAAQQVNASRLGEAPALVRTVVLSALAIELAGALLLAPDFIAREGLQRGLYYALFHSVSAFNNAGFSLYPTGLTGLVGNLAINIFIPLLIILGGMGFLVQVNVLAWLRDRRNQLSTNTRISLAMTFFLLLSAPVLFGLMEWNNPATLGGLPLRDKLLAAWFQGVTPRTAGFNTLDYAQMTFAGLFYSMLLMLIGGNSGSTAGGIKTNTVFVMVVSAWSLIRGRKDAVVFDRRLGTDIILRAMSVGLLSLVMLALGILLLLLLNSHGEGELSFIQLVFEAVSAFATVGLSMNATALLNPAQELVIIALMFLGRIGPLTLAVAFAQRELPPPVRYPQTSEVLIG
ncbi:potassium uptake protein, TrkH family [Deinococcus proteolyticus MRP]|uniref:Potassium uptake protein, TrkH family n=1 Tax=Deinococcus proteolyticus (strain ATCC 35074 / DSM 20540 / JCM 6276 / NBRC 101906 / NCIMB 13154 / VKM Ac-1939 / CCM 2703 / MRP) TaxID=693977 RepID=F0RJT1_DEIPM|nr:TrkH family potassium uptake protein [Deinococcus proteolyticus]ADY25557.1 potassium uptake protein, TrkH family [Deinococcus proteolyticus MRP]